MVGVHEINQPHPFRMQQEELDQRLPDGPEVNLDVPNPEILRIAGNHEGRNPHINRPCGQGITIRRDDQTDLFNEVLDQLQALPFGQYMPIGNANVHGRALEPFQHDGKRCRTDLGRPTGGGE